MICPGRQITVTVKLQLALFPAASTAVQLIVVAPQGNTLGVGEGEQVTLGLGSQLSVAVTMGRATGTGWQLVLITVMFVGQTRVGGVPSLRTVTVKQQKATVPAEPNTVLVQQTWVTPGAKTVPEGGVQVKANSAPVQIFVA